MEDIRAIFIATLLLAAGAAGCLGGEDGAGNESTGENDSTEETAAGTQICKRQKRSGTVTPAENLSATAALGEGPVTAKVDATAFGVGQMTLLLEHEGTEVWSDQSPDAGDWNPSESIGNLEPGSYTLTASIDAGQRDVEMTMVLTAGQSSDC